MRALAALLLAAPAVASAHSVLPFRFLDPVGPCNEVARGEPLRVEWFDGDLGAFTLTFLVRDTPPPSYIHAWPTDQIQGEPIAGPVDLEDRENAISIDTAALSPGHHFLWVRITDAAGVSEYEPPGGVFTVVAPGDTPPPAVWFDTPDRQVAALEDTYEVRYSTCPNDGVTVELLGSMNDVEGEALRPLVNGLPGGLNVPATVSLRCEVDGALGLQAVVRDGEGREGRAFPRGRISWRRTDARPADCPPLPEAPPRPEPPKGGSGCGGAIPLLPVARRRSAPR